MEKISSRVFDIFTLAMMRLYTNEALRKKMTTLEVLELLRKVEGMVTRTIESELNEMGVCN